jgi:hypothetical protein
MLKLDFLRRYDVADMLMLAASVLVVVTIPSRDLRRKMLASIVTPAEIEHRRLVARHLFDALSAQYPNKYVTLVLPQYPRRAKAPLRSGHQSSCDCRSTHKHDE